MNEILHKRTERAKHFDLGNGNFQFVGFAAPIHYKNALNQWDDIVIDFQPDGLGNLLTDKNKVSCGFRQDGKLEKYFGLRYDADHQFEATIFDIELGGIKKALTKNFATVAEKFSNRIIKNKIDDNIEVINRFNEVSLKNYFRIINPIKDFSITEQLHLKGLFCSNKKDNKNYIPDEQGNFNFVDENGEWKFGIKHPFFVDALGNNYQTVQHELKETKDGLFYTKTLTKEGKDDLVLARFPIEVDADTFYSTTVDALISTGTSATWATVHNASSGASINQTGAAFSPNVNVNKGNYSLNRSFHYFDTSTIGLGKTVTDAVLSLYGAYNSKSSQLCIQKGTQADTPTTSDFDNFSGNYYAKLAVASWVDAQYNDFTFNAQGKSDIVLNGTTKLCIRDYDYDYLNSAPGGQYITYFWSADEDQSGERRPRLVVTYTAGGGGTNVEVTPSAVNATFATVAPTISAAQNVNVSPSVQNVVVALLAAVISAAAGFAATPVNATFALPVHTISVAGAGSVAPATQNSTFSLPASTITAVQAATVSPSVLNATFALSATTVTANRAVTISPSALNATFSLQTATITAIQAVTISPNVLNATFALPSATVTAIRTVNFAATTLNSTFAIPAVVTVISVTINPAVLNVTFSLGLSAVTGKSNVAPTTLNATFAVIDPVVAGAGNVNIAAVVLNATFATLSPAITTVRFITVSPSVLNATFAIQTPSVLCGGAVNFDAATVNATFATSTPTVSAVRSVNFASNVVNATFALPSIAVSGGISITVSVNTVNAAFAIPAPVITANRAVTVTPSVLNANFAVLAPTIELAIPGNVLANTLNATFVLPAVLVLTGSNVTNYTYNEPSIRYSDINSKYGYFLIAVLNATFALPAHTISAVRAVNIAPTTQNATFALPASTTTAIQTATVSPSVLNAVFALPVSSVGISKTVSPAVLNATFAVNSPTITAYIVTTIYPTTLNAVFDLLSSTIRVYKNGIRADVWTPRAKITTSWTTVEKITTNWSIKIKNITAWNKVPKP